MKKYFNGWYFKNVIGNKTICFIPGIAIHGKQKTAFIQVIDEKHNIYIPYPYEDFIYNKKPFYVRVGNSFFSPEKLVIDINYKKLNIKGELYYSNLIKLKTHIYTPNIMGPFAYIPNMQCKHDILSLSHKINGQLMINHKLVEFNNGTGYIERDSGRSFPQKYTWLQCNTFEKSNASFMVAIASIPFTVFKFTGLIAVIYINNKEYRFATYNNSKIKRLTQKQNHYFIELQNNKYLLEIKVRADSGKTLKAPVNGAMANKIKESLNCKVFIKLSDKAGNIIYHDTGNNGAFEWQLK